MDLSFNSCTGFVPLNYAPSSARDLTPGALQKGERETLRSLARRVAQISQDSRYGENRRLWILHNRLRGERPMIYTVVESAWKEMLPFELMRVSDLFWRQWEWYLRHLIHRHENIADDFVILPVLKVPVVFENTGWGLEMEKRHPEEARGAYRWESVLRDDRDLARMKFPRIVRHQEESVRNLQAAGEVFHDILPVQLGERTFHDVALISVLVNLHGLERTLIDMHDNPGFLHRVMEFVTQGTSDMLDGLEAEGILNPDNENDYTGSGALGFSDELPAAPRAPGRYLLQDLWGFAAAQEYTGISPSMFEEFAVEYQARLLKRFGMTSYGCCERIDDKIEMLGRRIPNLRRISVSPFSDRRKAAEAIADRYIYSWKPNPAYHVSCPAFSEENVEKDIRETLEAARGCSVEIVLKDTETTGGEPDRLARWTRIARQCVQD